MNHSFLLDQSVRGQRYSSTRWFYAGIHMVCVSSRFAFGINPSLSFIKPFPNLLINLMGLCSFYAGIHMVCLSSRSVFGIYRSRTFCKFNFSIPIVNLLLIQFFYTDREPSANSVFLYRSRIVYNFNFSIPNWN